MDSNGSTLSIYKDQIQVAPEYVIENLNLTKEFFSEALRQKNFQDGYSWSIPLKTSFGLLVDEFQAIIEISGTNMDESAPPPGATDLDDLEYDDDEI